MASRDGGYQLECLRYLEKFRVTELKELLRSMGVAPKGRKLDLYSRAHGLLMHGSPKIQHEIRRIYERTHQLRRSVKMADEYSSVQAHHHRHHSESKSVSSSFVVKDARSYVLHPDVTFKAHPFYKVTECIIRPTALVSTRTTSHGNSMMLQFHLTPNQVQAICSSRNNQGKYSVQVLLRFARKESSCEQEDFYPRQCYVKVNGSYCPLPGYNPQLSARPEYKRLGTPVNMTELLKLSVTKTNDIVFYWTSDILYPQGFCVSIDLVQSLSSSDLLQKLKQKVVRSPDISRALVREKLTIDRDSEISATSLRVSILCPLGKLRMAHPCRARACTHLQCFDASIYLQMNERKSRWVCPVCDNPAPLESLEIDGLFKEICAESSSNDIGFKADGSWYPISANERAYNLSPEKKCVRLTVEDSPPAATMISDGGRGDGTRSDPIVIDLTGDSDEEEEMEDLVDSSSDPSSSAMTSTLSSTPTNSLLDRAPSPYSVSSSSHYSSSSSSSSSTSLSLSSQISSSPSSFATSSIASEILPFSFSPSTSNVTTILPFHNFRSYNYSTPGTSSSNSDDVQRDFGQGVKRRCSSSAEDHDTSEHSYSVPSVTPVSTTALPVPVITEYAPTLPRFSAPTCIIPFLSQPGAIQTVLASSNANTLHSGFNGALSLDGSHQVPSFNFEDSLFTLLPLNTGTDFSESINIED